MGKWCLHASSFIFDQIVIKVAGNQDRHKSSDEFDFGPLVSMAHLYVFEMRFDLGTLDSGERSLPFGLLGFQRLVMAIRLGLNYFMHLCLNADACIQNGVIYLNSITIVVSIYIFKIHMSRDMTKPTKWVCAQRRLRSAWASIQSNQESSLCAQWVAKDPSFLHAHSEDSGQTGRMARLIWVFAGRTAILSCRGLYGYLKYTHIYRSSTAKATLFFPLNFQDW